MPWIVTKESRERHEVQKYVKSEDGTEHIWSNTWYGHHGIGVDCEWEQPNQDELWADVKKRLWEGMPHDYLSNEGIEYLKPLYSITRK